jgi:DNA-binding LytR/AlgR family response regulator
MSGSAFAADRRWRVKALVVDDEGPARRRLARMLEAIDGIEVIGQVEDGEAALRLLETVWPDVVFLDVRMPGLDGLSLAGMAGELPPIVFVTAYDEYAVRAFELEAVDYLLKPVRPERLAAAVSRVRARFSPRANPNANVPRVVSATRGLFRVFDAREITRFWACDKYTAFAVEQAEHLTEESLNALEQRLLAHGFVRVHRGELVRLDAIRALRVIDGGHQITLADGQVARVSRRALHGIKAALGLAPARSA